MTLAETLLTIAKAKGVVIATAESCTGGMVSAAITDIAGSSAILDRGFVTYTNEAKIEMLGVNAQTLSDHGAVSEEVAREMALGAIANSNATVAVSITGIAGPGGSDYKPEGRVCFGVTIKQNVKVETIEFGAIGRLNVRGAAKNHALQMLITEIDHLND
ncbi:damage-inducible protein CinA [Marivivens niveibacter]|uniref:Damage-inducible protein CinA n=1 Tax=Marivivens niveibacter TaxID=1930667 RepID=A0A251X266_9RHOB|nr:CinA family protein [Marivivens niveibacter]OUD10809.1 damage-inducible protein CinA [Marivivens niveibacter]